MPPRIAADTQKIAAAAQTAGWNYRLWTEEAVRRQWGEETAWKLISSLRGTAPLAMYASLLSDWVRWRVLAEYGGLYLDTDTTLTTSTLPREETWHVADIATHTRRGGRMETGCIAAMGERGMGAAGAACKAVEARLAALGDMNAALNTYRLPYLIGPQWVMTECREALAAAGYSMAALPSVLASCSNPRAVLYHWGAWSWHRQGQGETLEQQETRRNRRRNGPVYTPRTIGTEKPQQGDPLFSVPSGTKRIVIFSNVPGFDPARAELREGDLCIHINKAIHAAAAMAVLGTVHTLFVRHGHNVGSGYKWHATTNFDGYRSVIFHGSTPRGEEPWLADYRRGAGTGNATSGFICYQHARAAAPNIPIVLAGFAPGEDIGYRWPQHGWQYEAEYYATHHVNLIHP